MSENRYRWPADPAWEREFWHRVREQRYTMSAQSCSSTLDFAVSVLGRKPRASRFSGKPLTVRVIGSALGDGAYGKRPTT